MLTCDGAHDLLLILLERLYLSLHGYEKFVNIRNGKFAEV
jgi:hypothetical protein